MVEFTNSFDCKCSNCGVQLHKGIGTAIPATSVSSSVALAHLGKRKWATFCDDCYAKIKPALVSSSTKASSDPPATPSGNVFEFVPGSAVEVANNSIRLSSYLSSVPVKTSSGKISCLGEKLSTSLLDSIANYLCAQGVIAPPCRIGQKLFVVTSPSKGSVKECTVSGVEYCLDEPKDPTCSITWYVFCDGMWYPYGGLAFADKASALIKAGLPSEEEVIQHE